MAEDVSMLIYAHVHEKTIPISCGPGVQPVKWLGHVGIARYDDKAHLIPPCKFRRWAISTAVSAVSISSGRQGLK